MKVEYSVLHILNSICTSRVNRIELNYLIELTCKLASTYLKHRYKNLSRVLLAEDVTIKELGIDAIAPLFERDEAGVFIKIKSAFNNWQPPIEAENTALFFLNRLVARSVEKYVSELLRYSDPFFSKILDSINYLIEKNNYRKERILGTSYIVQNDEFIKIGSLPDSKFINELPVKLFRNKSILLTEIFNHISIVPDKSMAIPLNALVMKIKQLNSSEYILSENVENNNESEVDSIVNRSLKITFNKMQESYLDKNKINESEAVRLKQALENIVTDLRDGGINPGLHKYFLEQFTELSFGDYKQRYQNIFEYLFKILKQEISEQLKN